MPDQSISEEDEIERESARLASAMVDYRRYLHSIPEPGFREYRTGLFLYRELVSAGWDVSYGHDAMERSAVLLMPTDEMDDTAFARAVEHEGPSPVLDAMRGGVTGLVARRVFGPGPTVAFRFDMDALPITESSESSHAPARDGFVSTNEGWMHACGHDAHMGLGLGLARVLDRFAERCRGTVKLIFQPAEEGTPGGAAAIAARGHVDDVDLLLCTHIGLEAKETGSIVCGTRFMGTSKYQAEFLGHAAHVVQAPQDGANALLAAAVATLQLHSISPHSAGWFSLNVGVLNAGIEQGITPEHASMSFGLWAESSEVQAYVNGRVHSILEASALAHNVTLQLRHVGEAPSGDIDRELSAALMEVAGVFQGVTVIPEASCHAGEDGTVFVERVRERGGRAAFVLLGSTLASGHHTSDFDIDEDALPIGLSFLASTAIKAMDGRLRT